MHFDKNSQRTYSSLSMILYFYLSYKIFAIKNYSTQSFPWLYTIYYPTHAREIIDNVFDPFKETIDSELW